MPNRQASHVLNNYRLYTHNDNPSLFAFSNDYHESGCNDRRTIFAIEILYGFLS